MEKLPLGSTWSNRAANGKTFKNLIDAKTHRISPSAFLKFMLSRMCGAPGAPPGGYAAFGERWYKPCDMSETLAALRADPDSAARDHVFWIGHATSLLCLRSGTNILFDPIFSHRCSPLSWAGPARRFPPATAIAQLPRIDIVTISHNHYDHLDQDSVVALYRRFPDVKFVVPLRMEGLLAPWGIPGSAMVVMDWWEEARVLDVVVACTPAQHWGRHGLCDNNEVLWCGWCVGWAPEDGEHAELKELPSPDPAEDAGSSATEEIPTAATVVWKDLKTYYFTGDTALNEDMFRTMHKRFTRVDMAALPIGAYEPREFMRSQHIDPQSAVRVFQILGVRQALAVHWGTFELANEVIDEPPQELAEALAAEGIDPQRFVAIPMGHHIAF